MEIHVLPTTKYPTCSCICLMLFFGVFRSSDHNLPKCVRHQPLAMNVHWWPRPQKNMDVFSGCLRHKSNHQSSNVNDEGNRVTLSVLYLLMKRKYCKQCKGYCTKTHGICELQIIPLEKRTSSNTFFLRLYCCFSFSECSWVNPKDIVQEQGLDQPEKRWGCEPHF